MALITQFAQPGMYVARGMAEARENRLAMAAEEAERATERAQQEAIRNILGVSGQVSPSMDAPAADPALAAAEAAGVPGVGLGLAPAAGGRAVGVQPPAQQPSQPQAPRLPYSERQIQAMTMVDRQVASEMRQQNAAAASVIERQTAANERAEARSRSVLDSAAQRVNASADPEAQMLNSARAVAEELNIPLAEAQERLQRQMQISAAPRDTEIERLMRGAGYDPQSEDGQAIYRDLLRRRREGSGVEALARAIGEQNQFVPDRDLSPEVRAEAREIRSAFNAANSVLDIADALEEQVQMAGPIAVTGAAGLFRRTVTGLNLTLQELRSAQGASAPAANAAANVIEQAYQDALGGGVTDEAFEELFGNPDLSGVQMLANALAYTVARVFDPSGPLSTQDVNAFRVDASPTTSTAELLANVSVHRRLASRRQESAYMRMEQLQAPREALFSLPEPRGRRGPSGQPPAPGAPAQSAPRPAPAGVEPEVWEFMTPEQRALWDNDDG
jgi:hypothetical protein